MYPSTDAEGATSVQSRRRQGASEPRKAAPYGTPSIRSTGGRRFVPDSHPGDVPGAAVPNVADLKRAGLAPKGVRGPENQVTTLEPAGREEQLKRWGVSTSHRWSSVERRPRQSDELEPDAYHDADETDDRGLEELGFLLDGGWTAVEPAKGRGHGTTSHRGVIHPDEHVDADALRSAVEAELGFTYDEAHAVYRQGKKSDAQLELRARLDARLLELSALGSNMTALGRVLGFPIRAKEGDCQVIKRAIERAKDKERN